MGAVTSSSWILADAVSGWPLSEYTESATDTVKPNPGPGTRSEPSGHENRMLSTIPDPGGVGALNELTSIDPDWLNGDTVPCEPSAQVMGASIGSTNTTAPAAQLPGAKRPQP